MRGAIRLTMEEPWHTYWQHPGDVGLPSKVFWERPSGWSAGSLQFPAPHYIETAGLISYAYEKEVLLPFELKVATGGVSWHNRHQIEG